MTAHPVIAALRSRPANARIALVVEGGGMRGAVSGGMALGLDELGLAGAFDAAYGSSAGTLNAMWLVSGRVRDGIPTWTDPRLVGELISRRRGLTRRGPVVDVEGLVEERYELRDGSGGDGEHRGGDGVERAVRVLEPAMLNLLTDRRRHAPEGAHGGEPGACGENLLNDEELPAKAARELAEGDVVTVRTPGGGGYGKA